jgi:hypothetical protein
MQDLCELEEFELDVVAGGNPITSNTISIDVSAISSSVATAVTLAFSNAPSAALAISIDQSVS